MDGRKRPGGAEKARLKKRKPNVPNLPIYFQEDKHKWQLVKREIGLMISNVTIRLTL